MASFLNVQTSFLNTQLTLLNIYGRYMHLKIFVDDNDLNLKTAYVNAANLHNNKIANNPGMIDAGFDILTPDNQLLSFKKCANKVDFNIICASTMILQNGIYNTGFYMYPRSSISKTPLRLANNVGIIDAGYRGHLMGMFDLVTMQDETISKFDRYLQICAPCLVPIFVEIVNAKEDLGEQTERGEGGFGSTGR
jgi:dUTP pyrophosphatase